MTQGVSRRRDVNWLVTMHMFGRGNVACFPWLLRGTRVHAQHGKRTRSASSVMREVIDIIDQILARLVRNAGSLLSLLPDRRYADDDDSQVSVPRIQCVTPETRWVLSRPRCHEGTRERDVVGHRDRIRIRDTPTPPGCRVYVTHPGAHARAQSLRRSAVSTRRASARIVSGAISLRD
ncbi:hypothetical protein PUN28_013395 [Cardiocondyla obscurior]|uniref:Uncharacterized protein n=1 Tax=Cardiocondyla obscurior TaxID=286306 RepID=A0AAW2F875_9HYME